MPDDELELSPPDEPPGAPDDSPEQDEPDTPAPSEPKTPPTEKPPSSPTITFGADAIRDLANGIVTGLKDGLSPKTQPSYTATPPAGPTVAELDSKIKELSDQIDLAVQEAKPIGALISQRDQLRDKKFELEHVVPVRTQGANSINALTIDSARKSDKYFVKYEREIMDLLGPAMQQGQLLTPEIVENAVSYIKGKHFQEIYADEREAETRRAKLGTAAPLPGATNGRARTASPKPPETIRERFGANAEEAFSSKRAKGYTEDSFAQRLGFQNKADWFAQDEAASKSNGQVPLDSVWDRRNKKWISPDEINEFYNA